MSTSYHIQNALFNASNMDTLFKKHFNCTLYTDVPGGSTDAVPRHVSFAQIACFIMEHGLPTAVLYCIIKYYNSHLKLTDFRDRRIYG